MHRGIELLMFHTQKIDRRRSMASPGPLGELGLQPFPAVGSGKLAKIQINVNGHSVVALLDSGCGACVAGEHLIRILEQDHMSQYGTKKQYAHVHIALSMAKKGQRADVLGTCVVT